MLSRDYIHTSRQGEAGRRAAIMHHTARNARVPIVLVIREAYLQFRASAVLVKLYSVQAPNTISAARDFKYPVVRACWMRNLSYLIVSAGEHRILLYRPHIRSMYSGKRKAIRTKETGGEADD